MKIPPSLKVFGKNLCDIILIMTTIIIAGIGPGNPELITLSALHEAVNADIILVPRSRNDERGIAEAVILHHMPGKTVTPITFPMTRDSDMRDKMILSQVESMREKLCGRRIFFPVIGDSSLYSTGAYLVDAMKKVFDDVDVRMIPGVSAHSAACASVCEFLAMSDEILSIIPGTADPARISAAIGASDSVAIYKPSAIRDMKSLIPPQKFRETFCVEHAGTEREKIYTSLDGVEEYMSVVILKR